jgi:hypothetical protein
MSAAPPFRDDGEGATGEKPGDAVIVGRRESGRVTPEDAFCSASQDWTVGVIASLESAATISDVSR